MLSSRHGYSAVFASIIFTPDLAIACSSRDAKSFPFIEATATAESLGTSTPRAGAT